MPQKSIVRLLLQPLLIAVVLALALRCVIDIYSIPSDSMEPALLAGDHILVTPYRFGAAPDRGQVVVFRSPQNVREFVVKRVIALPGDVVATTSSGVVTIGGRRVPEPYLRQSVTSGTIAPQIVPGGCYFVMGDNRRDSLDSRSWGVLPGNLIVGRARLVLWSSGGGGTVPAAFRSSNFGPNDARPASHRSRIFLPIAER